MAHNQMNLIPHNNSLTYGDHEGNVDPAGLAPLLEVDDVAALWRHLDAQLVPLAAADAVVVEDAAVVEGRVPARTGGIVGETANIGLHRYAKEMIMHMRLA